MSDVIRLLDSIGGEVAESEIVHHEGEAAVIDAFELAEAGLVEVRTYFSLTEAGRERLELTAGEPA